MWGIILSHSTENSTLICTNPDRKAENIGFVKLVYKHNDKVDFYLDVKQEKSDALAYRFLAHIKEDDDSVATAFEDRHDRRLEFSISVANNDLSAFNQAINILRQEIKDFTPIENQLIPFILPSKEAIAHSFKMHRDRFVRRQEAQVENNMRASVFTTARNSEAKLRAAFGFPAPNYGFEIPAEPNVTMELEDFVTEEYSSVENKLIDSLNEYLMSKLEDLLEEDYVEYANDSEFGTDLKLTAVSIEVLTAKRPHNFTNEEIETAKFALDLIATIRALELGGSHSHNRRMHHTEIKGYGMRNIVALMWHCCQKAKKTPHANFIAGVTFDDAFAVLIRGVANGARGGNRNLKDSADNLELYDKRICDQGRYNYLIAAFLGILPQVEIVFDICGPLLKEIQEQILIQLIADPTVINYKTAILFLDTWLGKNKNPTLPLGYQAFTLRVKSPANLGAMINGFLDKFCSHDPCLKARVKKQIDDEVALVERSLFGMSYLEQVSPTHAQLTALWQEKMSLQSTTRSTTRPSVLSTLGLQKRNKPLL
jgi:hypothetical protein